MGTDERTIDLTDGAISHEDLTEFFPDHPEAADLLMLIWDIIQSWDDAYDGDPADHHDGYKKSLIQLPHNPLYTTCGVPFLMSQCYYDWMTANRFEENMESLHKAYMLRAGYFRIIISVMHMLRGPEVTVQEAPVIWRMYIEDWDDYVVEMADNAQNRKK